MDESGGASEEGKVIDVADFEHLRAVEIGDSTRSVDGALVVESGVVGGVSGGSGVDVFGKGVGGLDVALLPAPRQRGLERMIDRVRVIGEDLISGVAVQTGRGRAGDCIRKGVGGDLMGVAAGVGDGERMRGTGVNRLDGVAGFAQVRALGADVAEFKNPLAAQVALHGEIPLLGVGHDEVAGHFENEKVLGGIYTGSSAGGRARRQIVAGGQIRIVARKSGELRKAGQPRA